MSRRRTSLTPPPGAQLLADERGKALFPIAHRLMGELEAAHQEHLGQITQAQLVAQPPEYNQQDNVGRKLQVIEGGASAFVEAALAVQTAEGTIAKRGFLTQFAGLG